MERFEVYRNSDPASARQLPYFLILQSELLDDFPTRVVAPLIRPKDLGGTPIALLNPCFEIDGQRLAMYTQQIAGIPKRYIGKFVCGLGAERDAVLRALDFLFSGI
jgi:toxin CcdB